MHISKSIETEKGTIMFQGELEGEELDMVLKLGLMHLLARGAVDVTVVPEKGEQH